MNDQFRPSRRIVFHGLASLGVAAALAGCGSDEPEDAADTGGDGGASETPPAETPPAETPAPGGGGGAEALASTSEVPVGGGLILTDEKIVIAQPTEGEFLAFSAVCTHQGGILNEVDETFHCPLHGSQFNLDGSVATGPATSPLPPVEITVQGTDIVKA